MRFFIDDDAFVRAPVRDVYPTLTNMGAWPDWWPALAVAPLSVDGEAERWRLDVASVGRLPRLRLIATPGAWRHDAGFTIDLEGADVRGRLETWLETGWGGTVVHFLAEGDVADGRRGAARLAALRAMLRRGSWGLKDHLQAEARTRAGLPA